jgi:hypothetical protein
MQKPISTRTHGVIDYVMSATFFTLPRMLGWSPEARRLADAAGGLSTAYATVTDYELGVARVLPMKGHLAIDVAQSMGLVSAPLLMPARDRGAARTLMVLGLIGLTVGALTETRPSYAH